MYNKGSRCTIPNLLKKRALLYQRRQDNSGAINVPKILLFGTMLDLKSIKKKINHGEILFISDFTELGNYEAVRKSLQRLTKDDYIKRIAKGIYFLPKKHKTLGILYPHAEQIAKVIAKCDKARIIATGSTALNLLGLSNGNYLAQSSEYKFKPKKKTHNTWNKRKFRKVIVPEGVVKIRINLDEEIILERDIEIKYKSE